MSVNMLNVKYVNHLGETLPNGVYVKHHDLLNYEWGYDMQYDRIVKLTRKADNQQIPLLFIAPPGENPLKLKNKIMEVFEKDTLAGIKGRIYIGEYYKECFVIKSEKDKFGYASDFYELNIEINTDTPYWTKEKQADFFANEYLKSTIVGEATVGHAQLREGDEQSSVDTGLDYPFDYPYDYAGSNIGVDIVYNDNFVASDFEMIINGYAQSPLVTIGDNNYKLNLTIEEGEYATINSKNKTITLTDKTGSVNNVFGYGDITDYIFEKIQPGNNSITWNSNFTLTVKLFYERSEPEWI